MQVIDGQYEPEGATQSFLSSILNLRRHGLGAMAAVSSSLACLHELGVLENCIRMGAEKGDDGTKSNADLERVLYHFSLFLRHKLESRCKNFSTCISPRSPPSFTSPHLVLRFHFDYNNSFFLLSLLPYLTNATISTLPR